MQIESKMSENLDVNISVSCADVFTNEFYDISYWQNSFTEFNFLVMTERGKSASLWVFLYLCKVCGRLLFFRKQG